MRFTVNFANWVINQARLFVNDNCFSAKNARGRKYFVLDSQSQKGEHEKQIVFVTMYKSYWALFKVLHSRSVLITQFRKFQGLLSKLYMYRGDVEIKHHNIAKNDCLAFKTNIFCVSKPTFNAIPQHHVGS